MPNQDTSGPTTERFKSVELVADRIFTRIENIDASRDGLDDALAELEGLAEDVDTAAPQLSGTEKVLGSLQNALGQTPTAQTETPDGPTEFTQPPDIQYNAAYRQSQLPEGVEPLKPQSHATSEETTATNIRAMLNEHKLERAQEQIEKKVSKAQQAFPALEPQSSYVSVASRQETWRNAFFRRGLQSLDQMFRNYYFLAIALSGWFTLAMVTLIEPDAAQGLGKLSLLLLVAAVCMFAQVSAPSEHADGARGPHKEPAL